MDSAKLNDWMQVIGIFALVASLVFVGLQMKQTHEIALSTAYQSRAATVIEMVTANAANEKGLAAWNAPDSASIDSLSRAEVQAGNMMALSILLAYDNMLYQHESGFISDEAWATGRADLKGVMRLLFVRRSFETRLERMRPSLKAVFNEIIAELDAEQPD
jgi:hypothetical protein